MRSISTIERGRSAAFAAGKLFDNSDQHCASATTTCLVFGDG